MLNRWKKYIPITIINNQRLAAGVAQPEGPLEAWLCPLSRSRLSLARNPSHPPPCTKLRESERAREEPYFTYFLFQNVALFRNFLLKFWKGSRAGPEPPSLAAGLGLILTANPAGSRCRGKGAPEFCSPATVPFGGRSPGVYAMLKEPQASLQPKPVYSSPCVGSFPRESQEAHHTKAGAPSSGMPGPSNPGGISSSDLLYSPITRLLFWLLPARLYSNPLATYLFNPPKCNRCFLVVFSFLCHLSPGFPPLVCLSLVWTRAAGNRVRGPAPKCLGLGQGLASRPRKLTPFLNSLAALLNQTKPNEPGRGETT